jgi:hypothetical protein
VPFESVLSIFMKEEKVPLKEPYGFGELKWPSNGFKIEGVFAFNEFKGNLFS